MWFQKKPEKHFIVCFCDHHSVIPDITKSTESRTMPNITTLTNSTEVKFQVSRELEIASFVMALLLSMIGGYVFINVQRYLESKTPGTKTLLDEFYIKLISYWMLEGSYCLCDTALRLSWPNFPWILDVLIVYTLILVLQLSPLHLFFSLLCNIILIFKPALVEEVDDKKVIRLTM